MQRKIIRAVITALAGAGLAGAGLASAQPASAVVDGQWTGVYSSPCAGGTAYWNMHWLRSNGLVRADGWQVTLITSQRVWITKVTLREFNPNNGNSPAGVYALNYGSPSPSTTGLPWTYGEVLTKTNIPNGFQQGTAWVTEGAKTAWGNERMDLSNGAACSYSPIWSSL